MCPEHVLLVRTTTNLGHLGNKEGTFVVLRGLRLCAVQCSVVADWRTDFATQNRSTIGIGSDWIGLDRADGSIPSSTNAENSPMITSTPDCIDCIVCTVSTVSATGLDSDSCACMHDISACYFGSTGTPQLLRSSVV